MENRKVKESIKVALSFVITYAISLNQNWFDPAWAGFGIAMVAMPNFKIEQSFKKSTLRMIGTIIGSIVGLIIMGIAPQNRFLFMFLCALWIFITMYMMAADKNHSYMWNVLGFTCLIITTAGTSDPVNAFDHALYRILENILGVGVYTLVSFLIWPNHEKRTVRKAFNELFDLVKNDLEYIKNYSSQNINFDHAKESKALIQKREELEDLYSLDDFNKSDKNAKKVWQSLGYYYDEVYNSSSRLLTSIEELKHTSFETFSVFDKPLNQLISTIAILDECIKGDLVEIEKPSIVFEINIQNYSLLEQRILTSIIEEIRQINNLSVKAIHTLNNLAVGDTLETFQSNKKKYFYHLPLDRDYFLGALYASLAVIGGFLIWILFDPPGHSQWYMSSGANAMFIALVPQMKAKTLMKYFTIMSIYTTFIYTFIMPHMESYYMLGTFLFVYVFLQYYYLEGFAFITAAFGLMLMGFTNEHQSYSFSQIINTDLFNIISMFLLIALGYILMSTRPEKAYIKNLKRFFKSSQYLLKETNQHETISIVRKIRIALAKRDIETIPLKLEKWLAVIDFSLYQGVTKEQLEEINFIVLKTSKRVDNVVQRMESSAVDKHTLQEFTSLKKEFLDNLNMEEFYVSNTENMKETLHLKTAQLETKLDNNEREASFKVISNYHVMMNILEEYNYSSSLINWSILKEERFT